MGGAISALARRQHGVVTTGQLLDAAVSEPRIRRLVGGGWLHPLHRGVYAVGHLHLGRLGHVWAAVLACGIEAVAVSHRTAAWIQALLENAPPLPIDLTTLAENRSRAGIRVHRTPLTRADVIEIDGLPVTCPSRTLLDMATKRPCKLDTLVRRAAYLKLYDPAALATTLDRAPGHRGAAKLRRLLDSAEEPEATGNELEDRMLAIIRRARLPQPERQFEIGPYVLDFYWPRQRLNVETDGRDAHLNPVAFEADRERDARLRAEGITVLRFTFRQVFFKAPYVTRTLKRLLA